MTSLQELVRIIDICKDFERKHFGEVLIVVERSFVRGRWIIRMGATDFSSGGHFSKEVIREVIFGKKGLEKNVREVLESMYRELYDELYNF